MARGMLWLAAVACGVAVGNVYFPQAITPLVAEGLLLAPDRAALVVTAAQIGYACGIFLLVPLGDRVPYRPLIATLFAVTGLGLAAAGLAPSFGPLFAAGVAAGVATVVAPVIGPMVAGMVSPERRGVASGTVLAGSIGGMLLARTAGGVLGEWLGWRAPYLVASGLSVVMAVALWRALPRTEPHTRRSYPGLVLEPLRLLRTEPELRRSCWYQATIFGAFSAVWGSVALLLTGPLYGHGAQAVGLLALVNAATMFVTPLAGRIVDRRGPDPVNLVCVLAVIGSAVVLAAGAAGGHGGLVALVAGTLVLDVAMRCGMVANTVRMYALSDTHRGRLNTAYMTCGYLGGAVGSWLGVQAYARLGWLGVCGLVVLAAGAALARHLRPRVRVDNAS
ncbi:Predicted arabinose efflux permease, MFS family [Lentzea xinjiangensis]|uniref:Predicted arabinose efflux permease, MFS family n=1 Tax=Lentzea xinjiangensis TaxID=402600 RepID=A0A1H9QKC6_9PSEU|nr:MFS transporter [Lentzea xinjiangensis]SER60966.1 Predicted arabinose efflux permease, MFS family [Lentzea xinjiangensis]